VPEPRKRCKTSTERPSWDNCGRRFTSHAPMLKRHPSVQEQCNSVKPNWWGFRNGSERGAKGRTWEFVHPQVRKARNSELCTTDPHHPSSDWARAAAGESRIKKVKQNNHLNSKIASTYKLATQQNSVQCPLEAPLGWNIPQLISCQTWGIIYKYTW
jgi:hypothetical protein